MLTAQNKDLQQGLKTEESLSHIPLPASTDSKLGLMPLAVNVLSLLLDSCMKLSPVTFCNVLGPWWKISMLGILTLNTTKYYKLLPNSISYTHNCKILPNTT